MNYIQHLTHHSLTYAIKRSPGTPESDCYGTLLVGTTYDENEPVIHCCGECDKPKDDAVPVTQLYYCQTCDHTLVVRQADECDIKTWSLINSYPVKP